MAPQLMEYLQCQPRAFLSEIIHSKLFKQPLVAAWSYCVILKNQRELGEAIIQVSKPSSLGRVALKISRHRHELCLCTYVAIDTREGDTHNSLSLSLHKADAW